MITFLAGDATLPVGPPEQPKIVAHVCNDIGAWGRGFVLSVSKRWSNPELAYRRWFQNNDEHENRVEFKLGNVQFVPVVLSSQTLTPLVLVANMIAQVGIFPRDGRQPIRYDALRECLTSVYDLAQHEHASVHMPRIGCGLAGGTWSEVEKIVVDVAGGIETYVYDFVSEDERYVPASLR